MPKKLYDWINEFCPIFQLSPSHLVDINMEELRVPLQLTSLFTELRKDIGMLTSADSRKEQITLAMPLPSFHKCYVHSLDFPVFPILCGRVIAFVLGILSPPANRYV